MIHDYSDIINKPYIKSKRHPQMSMLDRAAQFAPFAALTGHKEMIDESERLTEKKHILDESRMLSINLILVDLLEHIKENPLVEVTYYQDDLNKEGGSYITVTKVLKKIDEYHHLLVFDDLKIKIDDLYEIRRIEK